MLSDGAVPLVPSVPVPGVLGKGTLEGVSARGSARLYFIGSLLADVLVGFMVC